MKAKDIAILGAQYLQNQTIPNGKFIYLRDKRGIPVGGQYNLLRHMGAMGAIKKVLYQDKSYIPGLRLLQKEYLYSNTKVNFPAETALINCNGYGKLGAQALAVISENTDYEYYLNGLNHFVNMLTGEIAGHKLNLNDYKFTKFISEYYPGELVLALALTHNHNTAFKVIDKLWYERLGDIKIIQDHWLLQGLYYQSLSEKDEDKLALYDNFANKIVKGIMANQDYMGRCTPMACRVEGLIPFYKMIPKDNLTYKSYILNHIENMIDRISEFQNTDRSSPTYGAFYDTGGYRIDYTQHAICAFQAYHELMEQS